MQPDILIYMSDQQDGRRLGCAGDPVLRTPNLDRLAQRGTWFHNAYTSYPLCVPARAGFLTGQHCSVNNVYGNAGAIGVDHATFLHSLVAQGYETVLIGRMHFVGPDQRHGFTKRVGGDFCHVFWPQYHMEEAWMRNMGGYVNTTGAGGCLQIAGGGGVSPTREYDLAVIEWARRYLERPHDKPQCIVVGTYGPHFPYAAEAERFAYYYDALSLPESFHAEETPLDNPFLRAKQQYPRPEIARAARAAYFGLIEEQDHLFGRVMTAWDAYRAATDRPAVTVFTSDHGDQCGEHNLFGKQTFYEGSVRVPLLVEGDAVVPNGRVDTPASLLDLAPTLTALTDGPALPTPGGISLLPCLVEGAAPPDRPVVAEFCYNSETAGPCPARMVRQGDWKLCHYANDTVADTLYDLRNDPQETTDRSADHPDRVTALQVQARADWHPERVIAQRKEQARHHAILAQAGEAVGGPPAECWMGYAGRLQLPDAPGSIVSDEARSQMSCAGDKS